MRKILALAFTLLLIGIIPADALRIRGGGSTVAPSQTIASISLSNSSFTGNSPSGTVVGTLTITMSPASPAFSGTTAITSTGTDHSSTACTSTNGTNFKTATVTSLELNTTLAAGSYPGMCVTASQGGLASLTQAFTITGNAQLMAVPSPTLSNTTYTPNSANAVVGTLSVTMSPSTPASTAALTPTGANSGGFHLVGSGCANISAGTCTVETNSGGTTGAGPFTDVNFVATQASASNSPQSISPSLSGATGTVVDSATFINVGSGTTPGSVTPKHAELNLPPGAVPVGSIAAATVGGTPIPYQYDCAAEPSTITFTGTITSGVLSGATVPLIIGSTLSGTGVTSGTLISSIVTAASNNYNVSPSQSAGPVSMTATFGGCNVWPDGSLKNAAVSMFLPPLAASASEQVTWTATAGSYSSGGLGVTPATVAAASDYRIYAQNVNTIWVNNALMPPSGVQIGCLPTAGSIPSPGGCVLRLVSGSVSGHNGLLDNNCSTEGPCITSGNNTATVTSSSGSPSVVVLGSSPAGAVNGALVIDTTTPSNIPNNTVISSGGGSSTITLTTHATITNGDSLAFLYPVNGCTNAGFYLTVSGSTFLPTAAVVPSYGTGSACPLVGSGTEKFFFNDTLSIFGTTQPPSCAAQIGSAAFTGLYSGGTLTTSATTGAIAIGQVVTDSAGAHALITAGSGTSWTISAALTNGAMTSRMWACVYANGNGTTSGMYGIRLYGPLIDATSGAADPNFERVWGYVEYWQNAGTLVSARGGAGVDNSVYRPSSVGGPTLYPSETFDLDFTNGTTPGGAGEIRGAAQGAGVFTHLTTEAPTIFYSFDPAFSGPVGISATADWLGTTPGTFNIANSEAWNSVQMSRTGTDLTYWHGNHAHQPMAPATGVSPLVIDPVTTGGYYGEAANLATGYRIYDSPFMDNNGSYAWNNGGEHFYLSPDGGHGAYLWYAWANGASDHGMSWLQQLRISSLQIAGQATGIHEDVTGHALNLDYAWSNKPAAFTDPVELYSHVLCKTSFDPQTTMCNNLNDVGARATQTPCCGSANDASHWPIGNVGYIESIEGERWWVDLLDMEAQNVEQTEYDDYRRSASFAGKTWYGLVSDFVSENRVMGWAPAQVTDAIQYMPASEPEAMWQFHDVANWYDARSAWFTYVGSMTTGINYPSPTSPNLSGNKNYDFSVQGNGNQPYDLLDQPNGQSNMNIYPFEQGYEGMSMDKSVMELNHAVPSVDTVANYFIDNMIVQIEAQNTCIYNTISYAAPIGVMSPQSNIQQSFPIVNSLSPGWDSTDISNPQWGNTLNLGASFVSLALETYTGSTLVTAVAGPGGFCGADPNCVVEENLNSKITTTGTSPSGTTINIPAGSAANAFPKGIINDVTNNTGPYFIQSIASTTITLMASTPTTGIGSGDVLYISRVDTFPDYPISGGLIYPSGSRVFFTASDGEGEANANIPPHDFPVPTTPPGAVLEGKAYVWCQDSSGAWAGTINPPGTSCGSPAPITFSANKAYNASWVVNATCPPVTQGTWNSFGDYQSATSRLAEYWATIEGRITTAGTSSSRTLAETHMTPSMTPLSTTFGGGSNPRYNYDNHY